MCVGFCVRMCVCMLHVRVSNCAYTYVYMCVVCVSLSVCVSSVCVHASANSCSGVCKRCTFYVTRQLGKIQGSSSNTIYFVLVYSALYTISSQKTQYNKLIQMVSRALSYRKSNNLHSLVPKYIFSCCIIQLSIRKQQLKLQNKYFVLA